MAAATYTGDRVAGIALAAVAGIIWWQSTLWPTSGDVGGNPVVLPRILAGLMLAVGVALLLGRRAAPQSEDGDTSGHKPLHALAAIAVTILLAALFDWLGLIAAGIVYVAVLQRIVGAPWRIALPFAVAMPIVIWLVFYKGLSVPLPQGELWIRLGF